MKDPYDWNLLLILLVYNGFLLWDYTGFVVIVWFFSAGLHWVSCCTITFFYVWWDLLGSLVS
uniref:Putative ovule protein n=1 Tax=Solanum chacoense TaxID=4108 RepID=A0A0V0HN62_SOLCH